LTRFGTPRIIAAMPPPPRAARRGVLEVLGAAVLFGTTGTAASFAPGGAGATAIGSARLVIGGLGLVALLPRLGGRRDTVASLWRSPLGLAAGLLTALYQLTFFAGVASTGVALATLVTIGSGPVLVGTLAWAALGERPTRGWWIATSVCIVGLGLLALDGDIRQGAAAGGLGLSLAAGAAYAGYTVATRQLMLRGARPAEAMAAAFGLGAVVLLPVLLVAGVRWLLTSDGIAVALWLGLVTTTIAYLLFGRGLHRLRAGPVATLVLAEPLVATLLGIGLLGESLGAPGWLGALLLAAGLMLQGLVTLRVDAVAGPSADADPGGGGPALGS
jgi:DME family drug/metabolite transporter